MKTKFLASITTVCWLACDWNATAQLPAPPPNDHFTNAQNIASSSGTLFGTLLGATAEPGENTGVTGGSTSVWYRWTPPADGTYVFHVGGLSNLRASARVFSGSEVTNLMQVSLFSLPNELFNGFDSSFTAAAGQVYYIAVNGAPAPFSLSWGVSYVTNDYWWAATRLRTATGSFSQSTVGATREAGEPEAHGARSSVWYRWKAPFCGNVTFDTMGSGFDTVLAAYRSPPQPLFSGIPPTNQILVAFSDNIDATSNRQSRVTFSANGGEDYWVAVDGAAGSTGDLTLHWSLQPDGRRPDLTVAPFHAEVYHETTFPGDCTVQHRCIGVGARRLLRFPTTTRNEGNADLYLPGIPGLEYEFHPCHQHSHLLGFADYRLVTNGTTVVTGLKGSFCLQDSGAWDSNAVPFAKYFCGATPATGQGIQAGWLDYYWDTLPCQWIDITGVAPGVYTLEVEVDPANQLPELNDANNTARLVVAIPPEPYTHLNDFFAAAYVIHAGERWRGQAEHQSSFERQNNIGATREPGEPALGGGHTVWFRWTAPADGVVTFDTLSTVGNPLLFDTVLGVFTGPNVSNLTEVARNDDIAFPDERQSLVRFLAAAGTEYHIAVDGHGDSVGTLKLNWAFGAPAGDNFADAQIYDANRFYPLFPASVNATKEPDEPNHAGNPGGRSLWFKFDSYSNRPLTIGASGSDFDTLLAVYTGTSVSNLTLVAANDDSGTNRFSEVEFPARAGTRYWIAVDGKNGASGRVQLSFTYAQAYFSAVTLTNGQLRLLLEASGDQLVIESSSNLQHWTPLFTNDNDNGVLEWVLPIDLNPPQRFFRARQLPDRD